eukprot:146698_1
MLLQPSFVEMCNYINLAIILCVVFPLLTYSVVILYRNWDTQWLERRHKWISLLTITYLCINSCVIILIVVLQLKHAESLWIYISSYLLALSIQSLCSIYGMRLFMWYFVCGYASTLQNFDNFSDKNWFIRNKNKFQNKKWLLVYIATFIITLVLVIIECSVYV